MMNVYLLSAVTLAATLLAGSPVPAAGVLLIGVGLLTRGISH